MGSKIPASALVSKLQKALEHAQSESLPFAVELTPDERKRALKWRPGGDVVVELVGRLVEAYGITLPGITVEDMNKDLELARSLVALGAAAERYAQLINDTILQAQAECWWAATAYYTTLSRLADANPSLQDALKPAVDFFAHGPRATKPAPAPSPTPVPAPANGNGNGSTGSTGSNGAPTT
nr:hypothetical protein [Kofleriaceae bacterium]